MLASSSTFGKKEKLCSQKILQELFASGSGLLKYPVRVVFFQTSLPESVPCQVMVSVSKKKFKRAHDRNRIKRQIREGYRLQKAALIQFLKLHQLQLAIAFIYVPTEHLSTHEVEKGIGLALAKVRTMLEGRLNKQSLDFDLPRDEKVI